MGQLVTVRTMRVTSEASIIILIRCVPNYTRNCVNSYYSTNLAVFLHDKKIYISKQKKEKRKPCLITLQAINEDQLLRKSGHKTGNAILVRDLSDSPDKLQ